MLVVTTSQWHKPGFFFGKKKSNWGNFNVFWLANFGKKKIIKRISGFYPRLQQVGKNIEKC
jgi:hypothetical protein